ncbi:MAG: deoxyribose-phosphate aldolase [Nakamurella sp.]
MSAPRSIPTLDVAALTRTRLRTPGAIRETWATRTPGSLPADDRLLIVAADHGARNALGVGADPMAMADRADLLQRLLIALDRPGVDGVLGTADILDDLLLTGALDGKIVLGSMNRGGLLGASFELDDRMTGYTAAAIEAAGLDGGKMLLRIDPDDAGSLATLQSCAVAVGDLAARRKMAMLEPFWSTRQEGRVVNLLDSDHVIRSIQIASGLGDTSAYTWLKLPVVPELGRVMASTTLPTLLLGGDPNTSPEETYAAWGEALAIDPVRGLIVGRALLYPPDGDVAAAVDVAAGLVHATTNGRTA